MTQETLVLGGGPIGLEFATELAAQNQPVAIVDGEPTVSRAREAGLTAHESTLETATLPADRSASTVVVATASDARNLLLATAARRASDADRVVALVNDPDRRAAFDDAGIETVCVSRTVARATADSVAVEESADSVAVTESTLTDRAAEADERARIEE
ncbi:NAD-binding protein [Halomicrococcus gelatinilyticus]|uniref:NAD-binding protein n=1 Tax=Halomicrococcus gelatinilyticus TaxID=1702103 RepID=UPI002E111B10